MIEQMLIHRFRGIREGHIKDLRKFNILVGPNNSGKTALLEMLYMSGLCGEKCTLRLSDESYPDALVPSGYDFVFHRPMERLWKRHGERERWDDVLGGLTDDGALDYRLDYLDKSHPLSEFRLIKPQSETIEPGGFSEEDLHTLTFFMYRLTDAQGKTESGKGTLPAEMIPESIKEHLTEEHLTGRDERHIVFQWYPKFVHYADNSGVSVWLLEGGMPDPGRILFFDFHTASGHFRRDFFDFAYFGITNWYEDIAASMVQVFEDMQGCRIELVPSPRGEDMMTGAIRLPGGKPILIDSFGDGARHAFKVIAGLTALCETVDERHPGLFLWEDPELFMHPDALLKLLEVVAVLIQDKPVQLFLTTQSLEVCYSMALLLRDKKIKEEDFRLFRLKLKKSVLISSKFFGNNLTAWLESGKDPRFWSGSTLPFSYSFEVDEG